MKKFTYLLSALALSAAPVISSAQSQFSLQSQTLTNSDNEPGPVFPLPTERQLKWNETEFYAFFHYGMNTYTNLEWGKGDEAESIFAPTAAPNPEQWLKAVQAAGMKGGIAVVVSACGLHLQRPTLLSKLVMPLAERPIFRAILQQRLRNWV